MATKNTTKRTVHTLAALIEKTLLKASRNRRAYITELVVTVNDVARYLGTYKNANSNFNTLIDNLPSTLELSSTLNGKNGQDFAVRYINVKHVSVTMDEVFSGLDLSPVKTPAKKAPAKKTTVKATKTPVKKTAAKRTKAVKKVTTK